MNASLRDQHPEPSGAAELREQVVQGLRAATKTLAPKFLYDDRGAALFERICEQPEYYLTRAELEILNTRGSDIAAVIGPNAALIEYGSGAGIKVRLLLDALERPASYTPVDISQRQLANVSAALGREYPDVVIRPVCADYTSRFDLPPLPGRASRRVAFFPGSTIGNFHPAEAAAFLRRVRDVIGQNGMLILGVDRQKNATTLNAAYNDASGVTAEFNLNLLRRLNRELGGTFDISRFAHRAFFNEELSRVEMHLESLTSQVVHVAGEAFSFDRGETIWTESSYKYDRVMFDELPSMAGFEIAELLTDSDDRFWVAILRVAA